MWLLAAGAGTAVLFSQDKEPTRQIGTPEQWPQESQLTLDSGKATLILFTHMHCHCTRTSMGELKKLIGRFPDRIAAHVMFSSSDLTEAQKQSLISKNMTTNSGFVLQEDIQGREAQRFGAKTSGHVVFYAPNGQLLFKGGITPGLGRSTENPGVSAIISLLNGRNPPLNESPVYGCSLVEPQQQPSTERSAHATPTQKQPAKALPDVTSLH